MKAKRKAKKVVFVLNDSDAILEDFSSICESLEVRVVTSQCVVEAVKRARKLASTGADVLAFVDLMVPVSLPDLSALRKITKEREKFLHGIFADRADTKQRLLEAREALMVFDSQTMGPIHEGGLTFLRESSAWIKEWRIVIVSAASDERISKSRDTGIPVWKVLSVPVNPRCLMEVVTEFLQGA